MSNKLSNITKKLTDDTEYNKLVLDACSLADATNKSLLMFYWKLGEIVKTATDGSKDGIRSVPQFLQHMQQAMPSITLKLDSIYNAVDVYENMSRDQIKQAQESGVALRNLLALCNKKVTPEQREDTLQRIAAGDLSQADIAEDIKENRKESKGPKDKDTDSKRAATIKITRLPNYLQSVNEKLLGYADAMDVLCTEIVDEEEIDKVQAAFREAIAEIENIVKRWESEAALARKVMDKTITTLSRKDRRK